MGNTGTILEDIYPEEPVNPELDLFSGRVCDQYGNVIFNPDHYRRVELNDENGVVRSTMEPIPFSGPNFDPGRVRHFNPSTTEARPQINSRILQGKIFIDTYCKFVKSNEKFTILN